MKLTRRKLWSRIALGSLVALVLIMALLPTAVGSRWIYQPFINRLAAEDFQLHIDGVQLRWLSALRLRGVEVRQSGGPVLVSMSEIKTDRGLLGYLLGGRRLGRIEIIDPVVDVQLLKDGSNLQRFAKAIDRATKQSGQPASHRPAIDVQVIVRRMTAQVRRASMPQPLVVIPPLDLDMTYQAASGDSRLTIEPTKMMDQVELTPELVELGLEYAVPLLARSAWFDGRISLSTGRIDVPLDTPTKSTGGVQLTLHQVRSGPSNPSIIRLLDFIASARQIPPQHELVFVDGSTVVVTMANSRVHHSGLKMGFPRSDARLQLSSEGSVGLEDRSLDLVIDLPIPIEQLARREQMQQLGVPTLRLPIGGTLDQPIVRWDALRGDAGELLGIMREKLADGSPATAAVLGALQGLADGNADETIASAVELIQQLRDRRARAAEQSNSERLDSPSASRPSENQPNDAEPNDAEPNDAEPNETRPGDTSPQSEEATQPTKRPMRDALRDLFRRDKE